MTKKLIVIILSVILCLAVVGGCFALYHKDAEKLVISFGSEQAVTLTTEIGGTGELNFNGVKLSPARETATQEITLNVNTENTAALAGLSGQLTVTLDGALKDAILLKASYVDGDTQKNLNASNYVISLTLPLDQLPEVLTLTATLVDTDDATFAQNSNKSATISVTWKAIDWAPVEGGYYIVGEHSAWGVNKDAILLDKEIPTGEHADKAAIESVHLKQGEKFKVVQWTQGGINWDAATFNPESKGVTILPEDQNNISPNADDDYFICVNEYDQLWIQPVSTVGK